MTWDIKVSQSWNNPDYSFIDLTPEQNITIILLYVGNDTSTVEVAIEDTQGCTNASLSPLSPGPFPLFSINPGGILLAANFTDPNRILYVKPGRGDPSDVDAFMEPTPLMAGSRLFAVLGITQRKIFSQTGSDLLGFTTPLRTITLNFVLLIQTDPQPRNGMDIAMLRLIPRTDLGFTSLLPSRVVEDFTNASILGGLAQLGGFWTTANGAFAMFFGANLLYFLLSIVSSSSQVQMKRRIYVCTSLTERKPLSALGIVHVFQRLALIRNWNEDFPALRTEPEGGRPGSDSAGIVAFICERLVDLDEPEPNVKPRDLEAGDNSATVRPVMPMEENNQGEADCPSETERMVQDRSEVSESLVSGPTGEVDDVDISTG
ncbi:hypothetical protein DFH07DRAFT_837924 [Mycena maculata]|uniref:Uncharacterized protein n=1 Tax=Mycena maculata TaxID=230809 RepID=A0AAD7IGY0_9AGAR|nr:hypothetical protein DFH07DRAFT_837924 [Mycena maculata]